MRATDALWCLACVVLVSTGQVLLRAAALRAGASGLSGPMAWISGITALAILVYGSAMVLWLWMLGRVPLTQAFAFFGLSFFLVPLLAHRFLGDPISIYTWMGAALVMVGIAVSNIPPG